MAKKLLSVLLAVLTLACVITAMGCEPDDKKESSNSPSSYTVTFTGEEVTTFTQIVIPGGTAIEPKAPTREDFVFLGWYNGETQFDFSTPINSNLTLVAKWLEVVKHTVTVHDNEGVHVWEVNDGEVFAKPQTPEKEGYEFEGWVLESGALYDFSAPITGDIEITALFANGSKQSPYRIYTAEDLVDFSNKVNDTSGKYYDKYYSLESDIDMNGVEYTPAGMPVLDEDGYIERYGFSGVFYGNNHKISNLTQSKLIRNQSGAFYMGLFATTSLADIRDLTLENVDYTMTSYNPESVSAYVGGAVAYARLTNLTNVHVSGRLLIDMMNDNYVYVGGVAGGIYADTEASQAYIVYVENCYANVNISVGEEGAFENGAAGGLIGFLQNSSSTTAVINSASAGVVSGGMFTGGLIGSISNYVSVINCYSSAQVSPTAKEVSYAGGLIGSISGDAIVVDSIATGIVVGKLESSSLYKSYAGGLIGHAYKDDYEYYYTAGAIALNSYYSGSVIRNGVIKSDWGESVSASSVNESYFVDVLKWNKDCWNFNGEVVKPTSTLLGETAESFTLSLVSNGSVVESVEKEVTVGGYSLVGELYALENENGKVFFDWEYSQDSGYRFYMPIVKDTTLTARWQDVTQIAGAYKGEAKLENSGNPINSGTIILTEDGGVQWVQGSVNVGAFVYNGEVIIIEIFNSIGILYGTLTNGNLAFTQDAGITGTVYYNFTKYEPLFVGEYISENGDILTFKDDANLTFESAYVKKGDYVSATYTVEGNVLTLKGALSAYFDKAVITINQNGTLTANFTPASGQTYALENVVFTKAGKVDYSNKAFIGEYNVAYASSSASSYLGEEIFRVDYYTLTFNENGTVVYSSVYTDTVGRYYFIESNSTIKMMLEGYVSIFTYDSELDIIYGNLSRGSTSVLPVVLAPVEGGKLYAYAIGTRSTVVFVNDRNRYFIENGEFVKDAKISGEFKDGSIVTVNGKEYFVRIMQSVENVTYGYYDLTLIGEEKGKYVYNGVTFNLNGFGTVSGGYTGEYFVENGKVTVLTDSDEIFGFNYSDAKLSGGMVTLLAQDGYQGVWYKDGMRYTVDGDYEVENYYKLVIDGYGRSAVYYLSDYGYRLNWGSGSWGTYHEVSGGIYVAYNSAQTATLRLYYNDNVLYSDANSNWIIKEASFVKKGYEGPVQPPVMPTYYAGSYYNVADENKEIIFNLKENLTGSFNGAPISRVSYDGLNSVYFSADSVSYIFTYGDVCTISSINGTITVAKGGVVTEIFPADLLGTWSGVWSGYGVSSGEVRSIRIQEDGLVYYVVGEFAESLLTGVKYDGANGVITGYAGDLEFTLIYNAEEKNIALTARDSENREWTATLTK